MSKLRSLGRRLLLLSLLFLLAAAVWVLVVATTTEPVERLTFFKDQVRMRFPQAPQLSTDELAARLESGEEIVLLDVRRPDEYAVSHLPRAVRVDPNAAATLPPGVDPDLPVVAYCSIGWRSSKWVEELRDQGVDAMNLEGSIFQWAAEDRPMVRGDEPTSVVHPYSRLWGWLVESEDRAYSPH